MDVRGRRSCFNLLGTQGWNRFGQSWKENTRLSICSELNDGDSIAVVKASDDRLGCMFGQV